MSPGDVTTKLAQDEAIAQVNGAQTGACNEFYANHIVMISGGKASPAYTEAKVCDLLTFINEDAAAYSITFGTALQNDSYAGENNLSVQKGHSKTITLSQAGRFTFHDATNPGITGIFNVTQ